jgi:outer membrane receptor protein involved in Fe transport
MTRDYFPTNVAFDTYNVERITLNSGANSILYGLGDPAGIINAGLKKAYIGGDERSIQFRYGSRGSVRTIGDFSKTILKDKLAVRFIGLFEDHRNQWDRAYYKDKRAYLTSTYKPTNRTIVRVNFEKTNSRSRPEFPFSLMDGYSGWIEAGLPTYNPSNSQPIPDGLVVSDAFNLLAVFDSPSDSTPTALATDVNLYPIPGAHPMLITDGPYGSDVRGQTILDESVFDYKRLSMNTGDGDALEEDADILSLLVEHKFSEVLSLEVAYYKEDYKLDSISIFPVTIFGEYPGSTILRIDPNTHLPNGSSNPNFLRPFVETRFDIDWVDEKENEEVRLTLAYEFDIEDFNWFGRHKLMGLVSRNRFDERLVGLNSNILISEQLDQTLDQGFDLSGFHVIRGRVYLGDPVTLDDPIPQVLAAPSGNPRIPDVFHIDAYSNSTGQWEQYGVPVNKLALERSNLVRKIDSFALGLHSFFLEDKLTTTLGYRKDKVDFNEADLDRDHFNDVVNNPNYWGNFTQDDIPLGNLETFTLGLVFKPFPWLRLHYNESQNFQPNEFFNTRYNVFGDFLEQPFGNGNDYGFTLRLLDGKLDVQFNWFEVNKKNVHDFEISEAGFLRVFRWLEDNLLEDSVIPAGRFSEWEEPDESFEGNVSDPDAIYDVGSFTANGIEIIAIFNPLPNWRMLFNLARQETVQSQRGVYTRQWFESRWPVYERFFDLPSPRPSIAGPTWEEWARYLVRPVAEIIATEGRTTPQQRPWRVNFVTNYELLEGPLTGFGFGGSIRWEDGNILGYRFKENTNPRTMFFSDIETDLENPIKGASQTNIDLWFRYKKEIRDGKMQWMIQLNIMNVFNKNDPIAIAAGPDGNPGTYTIPESTRLFLSNTFSF